MSHQKSNGGVIAIIITIIVTGGLVYLGLSGRASAPAANSASATDSMAGHHSGASGPVSDPQTLVGKPAPDFSFQDRFGRQYSRDNLKGRNVVLFFNEGMMCYPACWNQIAALGEDQRLKQDGMIALSVVVDSPTDWQRAVQQMPQLSTANVVHDTGAKASSAFGMLTTASSMHYGQLPGHSYVIIDKQGIIRHVYDDPNMAIHNDLLVQELQKLSSSSS